MAADDVRRLGDVVEQTAGAAGDDALVGPDGAVVDLIGELGIGLGEAALGIGLHLLQQLLGVLQELVDGPGVGGMEGQGDHGLHPGQVDGDHLVVICVLAGMQGLIILGPLVGLIEAPGDLVGLPDGGKTGGLGGHHVDAVAEVDGQALDTGACELQHAVVDKAAFKGGLHQGNGHVVGADALPGRTGEVYQHHLGHGGIPGVLQQLLGQLRAALAHGHGAQGAVAGVGVGAQDHGAALGHLLPGIGVDDALVGGNIDAAVLLGGGQAEHVVILVDGAAHGAQAVVTVGQGVGNGELLHAGGPGLLDDAHIGDVVGHHGVEADAQLHGVRGHVVSLQDLPGHGPAAGFLLGRGRSFLGNAVYQVHAVVGELDHNGFTSYILPPRRAQSPSLFGPG